MPLPTRSKLPHDVPLWVDPTRETYFVTICCLPRGLNQLAKPKVAENVFETLSHRNAMGIWSVRLALLMPDHVHLIVSFPDNGREIQQIISKWKEWTAKTLPIRWQRDFFEHRVRRDENVREKADYIIFNPVRAGLVRRPEDWKFLFVPEW
jgi:putative transposase